MALAIESDRGLVDLLRAVNAAREAASDAEWGRAAEQVLARLLAVDERLAVYGTLAPGRPNHGVLARFAGTWREGFVRGRLYQRGWGADLGYPGMLWDPLGEAVQIQLLSAPELARAWDRLDAFEGPGYRRLLVPVEDASGVIAVANVYALRQAPGPDET